MARSAFASLFECAGPEFLNHKPDGGLVSHTSPIRFSNSKDGTLHVVAVGPGVSMLLALLPKMLEEYREKKGKEMDYRMQTDHFGWKYSESLRNYRALSLVIANKGEVYDDAEIRVQRAEKALLRGLHSQIDFLGLEELPVNFVLGEFEELTVSHVKAGDCHRQVVTGNFRMNIQLEGPWFVGPMVSKGCGRIIPNRKGYK